VTESESVSGGIEDDDIAKWCVEKILGRLGEGLRQVEQFEVFRIKFGEQVESSEGQESHEVRQEEKVK